MHRRMPALALIAAAIGLGSLALTTAGGRAQPPAPDPDRPARVPLVVALGRPFDMPFAGGASLAEAAEVLSKSLGAPVALDGAALKRLKIDGQARVTLGGLDGVRLQTSLKLLLDPVGMTFRVVPEDNLLILTDSAGSDDPAARSLDELRALRRELADVRAVVEEVADALAPVEVMEETRRPTIIEEAPKPGSAPPERSRPG